MEHRVHVEQRRAALPYVTQIISGSMEPVLKTGGFYTVEAFPYENLAPGMNVIFWPAGNARPVAHRVSHRIGTDSWAVYGIHNNGDDTYRWILTRDNYIGRIK